MSRRLLSARPDVGGRGPGAACGRAALASALVLAAAAPAPAGARAPSAAVPAPASVRAAPAPADGPGTTLAAAGLPAAAAWDSAVRDARTAARARGARVRFALRVEDRTWSFRGDETTHAHSLVKATVLVAHLRRRSVRDRALTDHERGLLAPMIRRSANAPARALIDAMGGVEPLRRVGRLVGMQRFGPAAGDWGGSAVSALDEVRLFARLPDILPARHRDYAIGLLRSVVPEQRWGMPRAAPAGWRVAFKGGWNDRGRTVQAMRLDCRGRVVTASVLVDGPEHASSVALLERTARRLLRPLRARGGAACSSVAPGR